MGWASFFLSKGLPGNTMASVKRAVLLLTFLLLGKPLYGQTRPLVCTVTINSADEGEIFRSHLREDFDFLELTGLGEGQDWFEEACKQGIQCDILLISGHFAGTFFGKSGRYLSLDQLQRKACHSVCDGILKRPKEVFLFGCNTTAGKEADQRTPEQYARDLVEENGFSRGVAEELAIFRYSPLGQQTRARMAQVFPHARIYGFHSKAPLGPQVRWRLRHYFQSPSKRDYRTHWENVSIGEENKPWLSAMKGLHIRSVVGDPGMENPVCILEGDGPIYRKLDWINEVLEDENRTLAYIPMLDDYLRDLEKQFGPWEEMPTSELVLLESIQFNRTARERVTELLQTPGRGMLRARVRVLNFARRVGWYDEGYYRSRLKELLGGLFRHNLNREKRDSVCFMGVVLDLKLEDLPKGPWNYFTVSALGCVRPSDPHIHRRLGGLLSSPREKMLKVALWALGEMGTEEPSIQMEVVGLLAQGGRLLRSEAGRTLAKMNPQAPEVYQSIVNLLQVPSLRSEIGWLLGKIRLKDPEGYVPMVELLKDGDARVRSVAHWILGKHRPGGPTIQRRLVELLGDSEAEVCTGAAILLEKLKPWDGQTHQLLQEQKNTTLCPYGALLASEALKKS